MSCFWGFVFPNNGFWRPRNGFKVRSVRSFFLGVLNKNDRSKDKVGDAPRHEYDTVRHLNDAVRHQYDATRHHLYVKTFWFQNLGRIYSLFMEGERIWVLKWRTKGKVPICFIGWNQCMQRACWESLCSYRGRCFVDHRGRSKEDWLTRRGRVW